MPKMKSHSGSTKRFKLTGTGKVRYRKAWQNHRRRKSDQNLQLLGRMQVVPHSELNHLRRTLPFL